MVLLTVGISIYECYYRAKMRSAKHSNIRNNISSCRHNMNITNNSKQIARLTPLNLEFGTEKLQEKSLVHNDEASSPAIMTSLKNVKICKRHQTSNFQLNAHTNSLTINNVSSTNQHSNCLKLVKVHKTENKIKLDIISANCFNAFALHQRSSKENLESANEIRENIFRFSLQSQFENLLGDGATSDVNNVTVIHGIRVVALFWIILVHITTILSYVSS